LGKGTYGEVTRCIHIISGIEVAMKTFFFEVRNVLLYYYRTFKTGSTTQPWGRSLFWRASATNLTLWKS